MKTKKLIGNPTPPKKLKKCQYCKKDEAFVQFAKDKKEFRICVECIKTAVGNLL
jgi:hypothetical protein